MKVVSGKVEDGKFAIATLKKKKLKGEERGNMITGEEGTQDGSGFCNGIFIYPRKWLKDLFMSLFPWVFLV